MIAQSNRLRISNLVTFSTDQPAPRVRKNRFPVDSRSHKYLAQPSPCARTVAESGNEDWPRSGFDICRRIWICSYMFTSQRSFRLLATGA